MNYKVPICEQCGNTLKGRVPKDAKGIICFFCANPRGEQDDDENVILKSVDVTNERIKRRD
jgi:hypothetical protein